MTHSKIKVTGGRKLSGGSIFISGSSNQVTKCIIASLLTHEEVILKGCPLVNERFVIEELVKSLGVSIEHLDEHTTKLCAQHLSTWQIPFEFSQKNRIAILAVAPLLHRFQKAKIVSQLGGDKIGARPVDFHINGLKEMGAHVEEVDGCYEISVGEKGLHGTHIVLPFPSVMTTENLILAATLAKGRTVIENAAIEPEVLELVKMLQKMGADIMYNAHRTYTINGVSKLKGCEVRIMFDRNEAISYACAALATGGNVLLKNVTHDPVFSFLNYIQRMGAEFKINSEGLFVQAPSHGRLQGTHVEVEVHPGFMTDWQQPFMILFTQAQGVSVLHETIFENRLGYTQYLNRMGANILLYSSCLGEAPCRFKYRNHQHSAIIMGPTPLFPIQMDLPTDIRAAFALLSAALVAQGTSSFGKIEEVQRKYESLVEKFQDLGADISMI